MGHSHHHGHDHGDISGQLGHIVPQKVYLAVLIALLVLTVITVAIAQVDFGTWNIIVAMLVASVKAGLVGMFFMHLKYEDATIWLYVLFPIVLLFVMIGGIFLDNPLRIDGRTMQTEMQLEIADHQAKKAESAHH